jgi:hypothetical protein
MNYVTVGESFGRFVNNGVPAAQNFSLKTTTPRRLYIAKNL